MLMHKQGHATGENPTFPTSEDIKSGMQGLARDMYIDIYGDGSYTTLETWWCALGGAGCWIPGWNELDQDDAHRREQNLVVAANGQTGSSTRMELAAWIKRR